ncbi:MAG: hypothetical protein KKC99_01840 [Proteobacteria bacterium]|nr:hypothetical protein [Pseudomonadota bacterium]
MNTFEAKLILDLTQGPRLNRLLAFVAYHGFDRKDLAVAANSTVDQLSKIFRGKNAPEDKINLLVQAGIPRCLLPQPSGRKSRAVSAEAA